MQHGNQHDTNTNDNTDHNTDHNTEREFWHDEPTRRLGRVKSLGTASDTTGHGIARPTNRPAAPGSRQHSGATRPTQRPMLRRQANNGGQSDSREQPSDRATSGHGGQSRLPIDPLLRRLSVMIGATVLLIPVALLLRSGNEAQAAGIIARPTTALPSDVISPAVIPTPAVTIRAAPAAPLVTAPLVTAPSATTLHNHPLKRCDNPYTVAAGDYWIRLAGAIDVPLRDLLALNGATVATPLYPGRSVCLPAGTTVAAPTATTTTTTPPTTTTTTKPTSTKNSSSNNSSGKNGSTTKQQAPATTTKPSAAKPTPPASTEPPVTAPPNRYSAGEAEAIIRDVWPDDLEDEAVRIASRESHLVPTARNSCCVGLFQIYYTVHRSWLATSGVTSAAQLFDPRVNAQAAFTLYQRSGGFGAWGGS